MMKEGNKMYSIKEMNNQIVNEYEKEIKEYLKETLNQNNIICDTAFVDKTYKDMKDFIEDESAIIICAFDNDKLLGFIWGYEREVNENKRIHINYFIVNSNYRKQGIGKRLIEKIYKIAKNRNIAKIELMVTAQNKEAVDFYKKQKINKGRIE